MKDNTNRNQWIAIGVLGLMVLCLIGVILTGPIQAPVVTQSLWNIPTTPTATEILAASSPTNPSNVAPAQETEVTPIDNTPTSGAEALTASADTSTPTPQSKVCVGAGGFWFNDANSGIELGAYYSANDLNIGMPLQPFFKQVNGTGNNQIVIKNTTYTIPDELEAPNDGGTSQLVACPNANGVWTYWMASRSQFMLTSWLQCNAESCVGYQHDTGAAGSWTGGPSGEKITYTQITASQVPADLATHWAVLQDLIAKASSQPEPDHLVIVKIWTK